jgi:pimeloyl-ACP methyl ester carboxylesterase
MPLAKANGIDLYYEVEGDGPGLVMIPGTGSSGAKWRAGPSSALAAGGFKVITFDHRGTGRSEKPDVAYSTRMFAADVVGLLDALGIERAHIFGHSMGGRVAQWVALDCPARVRSLVLSSTGPGEFDPAFPMQRGIPLSAAVELIEKGYENYMRDHIGSEFFFTPSFAREHPEVIGRLVEVSQEDPPPLKLYLRHIIARQQHQTAERLQEITAPTLVVVGGEDQVVRGTGSHLKQCEYLAEHIPGAELKVIEGAAHAMYWEKPEEPIRIIVDFLHRH